MCDPFSNIANRKTFVAHHRIVSYRKAEPVSPRAYVHLLHLPVGFDRYPHPPPWRFSLSNRNSRIKPLPFLRFVRFDLRQTTHEAYRLSVDFDTAILVQPDVFSSQDIASKNFAVLCIRIYRCYIFSNSNRARLACFVLRLPSVLSLPLSPIGARQLCRHPFLLYGLFRHRPAVWFTACRHCTDRPAAVEPRPYAPLARANLLIIHGCPPID